MRSIKGWWLSSSILVVFLAAAPIHAGPMTVTAELNGSTLDSILDPGTWLDINLGNGSTPSIYYKPGEVRWTGNTSNSRLGFNFTSFCIELTEDISPGNDYTFNLVNLENAPNPGSSQTGGSAGMGSLKANYIRELWAADYNTIAAPTQGTTADENAAAFQLDIWKIEYDWTLGSYDTSFASGNFQASGSGPVLGIASGWLTALAGNENLAKADDLEAMSEPGLQDQLVQFAPVPPAVQLAGIGIVCLLGYAAAARSGWKARSPLTAAVAVTANAI